ncbi:hypothetical protein TNCV_4285641 [Trichonephila clavipes]|nr:hypothetical protein TNCV_4285641 [Trichonephila clavipes]
MQVRTSEKISKIHNCYLCAADNPLVMSPELYQSYFRVKVWARIMHSHGTGTYLLQSRLDIHNCVFARGVMKVEAQWLCVYFSVWGHMKSLIYNASSIDSGEDLVLPYISPMELFPSGHGHELVLKRATLVNIDKSNIGVVESWVRVLVPMKTHRVEGLMHVNSVVAQSLHVDVVWKFEQ